jgi:hypothetical protein
MIIKNITALLLMTLCAFLTQAELTPIGDQELDGLYGQALFRLDETKGIAQPDGTSLDFTKLTLGLKIEQNVTIDRVVAGRFYRPDGGTDAFGAAQDCISLGKICYYDQVNPWNCSSTTCGGLAGTYNVAGLLYGETFSDLGLLDHKEFSTFQSGFDPTNDRTNVDVILRDVTLGYVNDFTGELVDAVVEKPYLELAYASEDDGYGNTIRSVEGFRFGFENQNGIMGNAIDVFTGFLVPHATMEIVALGLTAATINIDPWVGGVRTAAYVDPNKSIVNSCVGLACGGLGAILAGGDPSTPAGLALASPEAQVFPLQSVSLVNAQGFFLSVQKKPVQWPDLPTGTPEVALPGVWINMGGGNSGLQVSNTASWHPDNYFPGHPLDSVYLPANNTNNGYY